MLNVPFWDDSSKKRAGSQHPATMATAGLSGPVRALALSARSINVPLRLSNHALQYLRLLDASTTKPFGIINVRHASHQAQGRANGPKNGAGKRLGAKKTGGMAFNRCRIK
jgi:hypothetical protein